MSFCLAILIISHRNPRRCTHIQEESYLDTVCGNCLSSEVLFLPNISSWSMAAVYTLPEIAITQIQQLWVVQGTEKGHQTLADRYFFNRWRTYISGCVEALLMRGWARPVGTLNGKAKVKEALDTILVPGAVDRVEMAGACQVMCCNTLNGARVCGQD